MVENLHYDNLCESVSGAALLLRMEQALHEYRGEDGSEDVSYSGAGINELTLPSSIEGQPSGTESSHLNYTIWLFSQIIASAKERGVQLNHYTTCCPSEVLDDELGNLKMWDFALVAYLGALEAFSHNIDFNQTTGEIVIDDASLIEVIEAAYSDIKKVLDIPVDRSVSMIATSENDHTSPPSYDDETFEEEGDGPVLAVQENIYLAEAFLCDALGLTRKNRIDSPTGFSRLPSLPPTNLD